MSKLSIVGEFVEFIQERKKWWLLPVMVLLVMLSAVLFFAQGSVVAPFIYTIF